MQFDEEPDYKLWRDKFRSLMSGKEELYDSSDAKPLWLELFSVLAVLPRIVFPSSIFGLF
jgi:hypothetical protein